MRLTFRQTDDEEGDAPLKSGPKGWAAWMEDRAKSMDANLRVVNAVYVRRVNRFNEYVFTVEGALHGIVAFLQGYPDSAETTVKEP